MSGGPLATRRLHFVGIGGAGMSGLAIVARALGAEVTGSDRAESSYTARLRASGIQPAARHDAANLPEDAEVVVSTAIPEDNPELAAARQAGARVLHRGELLGEVSRLKRSIADRRHSRQDHNLRHGRACPGGHGPRPGLPGRRGAALAGHERGLGEGDWIVVEADESDRSFLELSRDVAVVTNVELDHHHTYHSLSELQEAFAAFAAPAGVRIAGPGVDLEGALSYGIESGELRAEHVELGPLTSRFEVEGVPVELAVPGAHNVLNAVAALGACREAGLPIAEAAPALAGFAGAGRRFEDHGTTAAGARVFDDYAHHPTEVRATLEAARTLGARRLIACFQPHLFSRTRELARDFGRALALADVVAVIDVYPARERAEDFPGVSGLTVARAAADAGGGRRVAWLPSMDDAASWLESELGEGDVLLTLGAGNVDDLARRLAGPASVPA